MALDAEADQCFVNLTDVQPPSVMLSPAQRLFTGRQAVLHSHADSRNPPLALGGGGQKAPPTIWLKLGLAVQPPLLA